MFNNEFEDGMILEISGEWIGRPTCYYFVTHLNGERVGICFKGNINCESFPAGWLDLEENYSPIGLVRVYKPRHISCTFSGDFDNVNHYEVIWESDEK